MDGDVLRSYISVLLQWNLKLGCCVFNGEYGIHVSSVFEEI